MKKLSTFVICIVMLLVVLAASLAGCNVSRKVKGIELKFKKKIEAATELSFDMGLTIIDKDGTNHLDIGCYKIDDGYAYIFAAPNDQTLVYRRLYADNKYYEFLQNTALNIGFYSVKNDVPYTVEENLLYMVNKYVLLASYATLLSSGRKETLAGVETYRYDFNAGGNSYSLWYDNENLVQVEATFRKKDEAGNTTEEIYRAAFSNYKFADVANAPFALPDEGLYAPSPIAIEDWMSIITKFGSKLSGWAK